MQVYSSLFYFGATLGSEFYAGVGYKGENMVHIHLYCSAGLANSTQ